jgi:hypothetical protein
VLAKLRKDIRTKEIELARLKRDEEALGRLAGRGGAGGGGARGPRAAEAETAVAAAGESTGATCSGSCPKHSRPPMFTRCAD